MPGGPNPALLSLRLTTLVGWGVAILVNCLVLGFMLESVVRVPRAAPRRASGRLQDTSGSLHRASLGGPGSRSHHTRPCAQQESVTYFRSLSQPAMSNQGCRVGCRVGCSVGCRVGGRGRDRVGVGGRVGVRGRVVSPRRGDSILDCSACSPFGFGGPAVVQGKPRTSEEFHC